MTEPQGEQMNPLKYRFPEGVYEHYKGGRYWVIGEAFDADTPEIRWIVYYPLQSHVNDDGSVDAPMLCVRLLKGPSGFSTPVLTKDSKDHKCIVACGPKKHYKPRFQLLFPRVER